ncbi:MAG TPA: TROVE domain-containing protein [Nitrososphaera sp.]|nr:TROVE domain-containing protein [Nitrososphaera sp.]
MVRAAHHEKVWGTGLIRKYGAEIIKRPDEAATQLAYQIATFGPRPIPNSLKRAWAAAYERFNEYGLAKYKLKSRTVKTVDVVNLSHPASDAVNKLMRGELALNDETWEAYISQNGSNKDTWTSVLPRMGHMAVLRNLRNFMKFGVDVEAVKERLLKTQEGSMQLPFRYYSAYQAIQAAPDVLPSLLDTVEECLVNSIAAGPQFPGRVMSLCDNSGSAWGMTTSSMGTMHVAQIANLTGVITGMAADEGYVGVFGDRLEQVPVRKRDSLFEQTKRLDAAGQGIGGGTENGIWLFWDQAIRNKEHWDQVFVYSDMQAGHGGLYGTNSNEYRDYIWQGRDGYRGYIDVPKLISTYRQQVNPKVNVYLVQVAGYQDTIVPEYYDRTYILGGWSDSLLRFAAAMSGLGQAQQ